MLRYALFSHQKNHLEDDLMDACWRGDHEEVQSLCEMVNVKHIKRYWDGWTPLHIAAW